MPLPSNSDPPRVSSAQSALAGLSLGLAAVAQLCVSHADLALAAVSSALVGAVLVWLTFLEGLRARVLGKFFLMASTWMLFYFEAATSALSGGGFAVLNEMPYPGAQYDPALIRAALLHMGLFQAALLAGYSLRPRAAGLLRRARARVDGRLSWFPVKAALAACAFVPILADSGFDPRQALDSLLASYKTFARPYTDPGLIVHLRSVGLFGGALLLIDALLTRGSRRWLSLAIGLAVAAAVTLKGTRHVLLFLLLPVAVVALARTRRQFTGRQVAAWSGAALLLVLIFQVQAGVRTLGWDRAGELTAAQLVPKKEGAQFDALLFAEYLVPRHHDYFLEVAEPYFAAYWVPRSVWPEKPELPSWKYYNDVYTRQNPVWNVTPSVIGQFYMGWGAAGVIWAGAWFGVLAATADRMLLALDVGRQRGVAAVLGMLYAFLISSFRLYAPFYFAYLAFGFAVMLLVTRRVRSGQGMGSLALCASELARSRACTAAVSRT